MDLGQGQSKCFVLSSENSKKKLSITLSAVVEVHNKLLF